MASMPALKIDEDTIRSNIKNHMNEKDNFKLKIEFGIDKKEQDVKSSIHVSQPCQTNAEDFYDFSDEPMCIDQTSIISKNYYINYKKNEFIK